MGLIGGKMFAIDGCKLSSNASKEWSGTHDELQEKYEHLQKMVAKIMARHEANDQKGNEQEQEKDKEKVERLEKQCAKILTFLASHEKRIGAGGEEVKSNITDNESATIKGPHGVIQGYNGIAVADEKNQVIITASETKFPRRLGQPAKGSILIRCWKNQRRRCGG
jgi:hypothetical protein